MQEIKADSSWGFPCLSKDATASSAAEFALIYAQQIYRSQPNGFYQRADKPITPIVNFFRAQISGEWNRLVNTDLKHVRMELVGEVFGMPRIQGASLVKR